MANKQPEKKFQRGGCSVSIFANEVEKDGRKFSIRKAVFQKRYKDSDGQWQSSQSLDINDIPKAVLALEDAYDYLTGREPDETDAW